MYSVQEGLGMLRCTIELIPGGAENHPRRKVIGVVEIANVGGDARTGHYNTWAFRRHPKNPRKTIWKSGNVLNFPRLRKGPYDLLYLALKSMVGDRNASKD